MTVINTSPAIHLHAVLPRGLGSLSALIGEVITALEKHGMWITPALEAKAIQLAEKDERFRSEMRRLQEHREAMGLSNVRHDA